MNIGHFLIPEEIRVMKWINNSKAILDLILIGNSVITNHAITNQSVVG